MMTVVQDTMSQIATYFMQHIDIGGKPTLVFYDTAASISAISKNLIERADEHRTTDRSVKISVVTDKVVDTGLSTYVMSISPIKRFKWDGEQIREVTTPCARQAVVLHLIRMERITDVFPKYKMANVIQELISRDYHDYLKGMNAPGEVGGMSTVLLIGIKAMPLTPRVIDMTVDGILVDLPAIPDVNRLHVMFSGSSQVLDRARQSIDPRLEGADKAKAMRIFLCQAVEASRRALWADMMMSSGHPARIQTSWTVWWRRMTHTKC